MEILIATLVRGIGIGSTYALIAVGFVIIYRATDVVNFAQPTLVILGAYVNFVFVFNVGVPFPLAVIGSMATMAVVGALIERVALRPMVGQPPFSAAMVTVGLFFALFVLANWIFGSAVITMGDPWGLSRVDFLGVSVGQIDLAKTVISLSAIGVVGVFLHRSKLGLAMRATALDQEVSLAQGINVGQIFGVSWAMSGALAALAGVMIGTGGGGLVAIDAFVALKALPVLILGGLDSIKGSVVAGLFIGVAEALTRAYQPGVDIVGQNFDVVVPYLIMVIALMVRPYGLYGTREVHRV